MDRPRLIRGLRIARMVGCGVMCVLLIALWVRSYWRSDSFTTLIGSNSITYSSFLGGTRIGWEPRIRNQKAPRWKYESQSTDDIYKTVRRLAAPTGKPPVLPDRSFLFRLDFDTHVGRIRIPHWLLTVPLIIITAVSIRPWIHWQWKFSLRTLLIATMLIAVVLGLMAWSIR
jgi:hypothetical protein